MNLLEVRQRIGPVLTIIIGVSCAVGVLISMLAMGTGALRQAMGDVRPDRVILTSVGARIIESSVPREEAALVRDLPGIRKGADGEPIVAFQSMIPMEGRRRVTGDRIFFPLVGISAASLPEYMSEIRFTSGRMFRPGLHELIASNPCAHQFTGFEIGDRRSIRGIDWTIVGHFDQGHSQQCLVSTDVETVMAAFARNTYNEVGTRLQSPGNFDVLRNAVKANPTLHLEVRREREVVEEEFKPFNGFLNFVSYFIGTIMAIGATLGAVNSLYSIVDSRRRELATLRAFGFGSAVIGAAMLCESILYAVPGALLGALVAWVFFNGMSASPFGYSFQLAVTPSLAVIGIVWALAMGLIGGLLPAVRAGRVSVTTALRAV